ncbi:MAG: TlpA family protein disulfide reductase [Ignavibacteria bacterium]|nr:TlpA family protein disulfide reductase [Ignavibacteria bacterium]
MKFKFILLPALLSFILTLSCTTNRPVSTNFSYEPSKPVAGGEVTVTFDANGSHVEKEASITLLVFEHSSKEPVAKEVVMTKDGSSYKGKFKSETGTKSLVVVFKGSKSLENNEKRGFRIPLYEKNGDEVKGSDAAYVDFMRNFGDLAEMSLKNNELFKLINNDFVINPGLKVQYYPVYVSLLRRVKSDISDSLVRMDMAEFSTQKDLDESHLVALVRGHEILKDAETATKYREILSSKFPKNDLVVQARVQKIRKETDLKAQKQQVLQFLKDMPDSKFATAVTDAYLNAFSKDLEWAKVEKEIVSSGFEPSAFFYNKFAKKYLNEKDAKPDLSLLISKVAFDKVVKEQKDFKNKPLSISESSYRDGLNSTLAMIAFTRGLAFKKLGKSADALEMFKLAVDASKMEDMSVIPEYLDALAGSGKRKDALEIAKNLKAEAKSNPKLDSLLTAFYIAENSGEIGLKDLMTTLNKKADEVISGKLKKELLDYPASDFTLLDLNGQEVSLSKLKGKTIVLDFWATWCGPCLASFPVMKKAVEKNASNPDVVFLFVNAWENVKDKKKNAADFITKNNYPFHVLMDEKDKVITDFEVSGIPTKFIINKSGRVKFESIGFEDNEELLLKELDMMIEMAK